MRRFQLMSTVLIIMLLSAIQVYALQPALPTSFHGKVMYSDGTPVQSMDVTAVWKDTSGETQIRAVKTLSYEEAESRGDQSLAGSFFFTEGYVLASPATKIVLTVGSERIEFLARPGDKAFELSSPITINRGEDTMDLSITDIEITPFDTFALMEWKTTLFANSQVSYTTLSGSHIGASDSQAKEHAQVLWFLQPSKSYTYSLQANDGRGNSYKEPFQSFSTKPKASGQHFLVHGVDHTSEDDSIVVKWNTKETCEGAVAYGKEIPPTNFVRENRFENAHFVRLEGLSFSSRYYFAVLCFNGNLVEITKNGNDYFEAHMRSSDSQPSLPTVVFGKVFYEDQIVIGIPIKASWNVGDEEFVVTTKTLSEAQAVKLGDPTLAGSFYFKDEQINAPKGTLIKIRADGIDSSIVEVVSDPGQYVGIENNLEVFELPEDFIEKKTVFEKASKFISGFSKTNLIIISIIAIFSLGFLLLSLIRYLKVSKLKRSLMVYVDKMVANQYIVESIEQESERETVRNYMRAKVGLIVLEMLQKTDKNSSIRISSQEEQKMILIRKGDHRAFTFEDSGIERMLILDVLDIYQGTVILRINHINVDLMMSENVMEGISFEFGRVRRLNITPVSIRIQEEGNSAYLLFQFEYV